MTNYSPAEFRMETEKQICGPRSMKTSAFVAIVLATAAISTCLITFPLIFNYVQSLESQVQAELDLCKTRARDMWKELLEMQVGADRPTTFRVSRSARMSADMRAFIKKRKYRRQIVDNCCTCQRGASGPSGPPGIDGTDGIDGTMGDIGPPGPMAIASPDYFKRYPEQCLCESPEGRQGSPGSRGPPGLSGDNGVPGIDGAPGDRGNEGSSGSPGRNGNAGQRGPPGMPGREDSIGEGPPGPVGPPGRPGSPGPRGDPGQPGNDGDPGRPGDMGPPGNNGNPGQPGQMGAPGEIGDQGPRGRCDHCPPPRLASGY